MQNKLCYKNITGTKPQQIDEKQNKNHIKMMKTTYCNIKPHIIQYNHNRNKEYKSKNNMKQKQ